MASPRSLRFGDLLKRQRLSAGLTQQQLAERAGLSVKAVSALESGARRTPRRDTVALLAEALCLSPPERMRFEAAARGGRGAGAALQPDVSDAGLPRRTAPFLPVLVGRDHERSQLARHRRGEGPPLLLLAGEPGIGKSRLLAEAAAQAQEQGWAVLAGGCHRRSGQEPFAPSSARSPLTSPHARQRNSASIYRAAPGSSAYCLSWPRAPSSLPRPGSSPRRRSGA
jgi:transcriptional regulator with XRE-family HTH domain